jgi:hypothetical protein
MKRYRCHGCASELYFGNRHCLGCGRDAAYLPDGCTMLTVEPAASGRLTALHPQHGHQDWRHCANRFNADACFWLVGADDPNPLCRACRLSTMIPNLSDPSNLERWKRVEAAKQWLIHSLLDLGLPVDAPIDGVRPLEFHLLTAQTADGVTTGHLDGLITLDVAEADDAERVRRREALGEPYRTLLGHFRHEVGHYYWQVLARDAAFVAGFRSLFGDERIDYAAALQRHYTNQAPPAWQAHWITPYASSHPWEDWAETWAHYMHMTDAVQTALEHGLSVGDPAPRPDLSWPPAGEPLLDRWQPIALLLNDLNRAVGMPDAYPFVVSEPARRKLGFVGEQVRRLADTSTRGG